MKVSVLMSTYNGEKYIFEQLESIRFQTFSPDEVIIRDDGSSDKTLGIIENYIYKNELDHWHFFVNEQNIGWKRNFYKLIDDCDADLIFLADQDDIWNKSKLEMMISAFDNKNINVLACGYDEKATGLDINYQCRKTTCVKKTDFSSKFMWVNYPGCAYCFRKAYFNSIKKWWKDYLPHDAFIFRNALLDGSFYTMNTNLIIHRVHANNAGTPKNFTQPKDDLNYYFNVLNLLKQRVNEDKSISIEKKKILLQAEKWLLARKKYYETGAFLDFIRLFQFIKYYPHLKTYIKEFLVTKYR